MAKDMSKNGKLRKAGSHLPALVDPRLIKGLDHVVRQHILLATMTGEISPKGLSVALDEDLSQVSYHVKVLLEDCDGLIRLVKTEPRRGAVEHYYRATVKSLFPAKAWRRLKGGLRAVVGGGQASDLFNDLAEALEAGKLQHDEDFITRTPLVLDPEGKRNVRAIAERVTREVEKEHREAARRAREADGAGEKMTGHIFAVVDFETAWEPADFRDGGGRKAKRKARAAGR